MSQEIHNDTLIRREAKLYKESEVSCQKPEQVESQIDLDDPLFTECIYEEMRVDEPSIPSIQIKQDERLWI